MSCSGGARSGARFAFALSVLLPVAAGCAASPPAPPLLPVVEETVTYQAGAAPVVIEHTTTIVTQSAPPAPPAPVAPGDPSTTPTPPPPEPEPAAEPFVHPPVRVVGRWVLQFQPGMTRPTKVSGRDPRTTKHLGDDNIVFVQGIVEVDGRFTQPRIIKGVRSVDDEVLSAVGTWRVTPVVFRGKPTAVLYTWPVKVRSP